MIILVAGPSGVGKTTLAKKLAERLNLPVIHKDDLKEILFETVGSSTPEQSLIRWKAYFVLCSWAYDPKHTNPNAETSLTYMAHRRT